MVSHLNTSCFPQSCFLDVTLIVFQPKKKMWHETEMSAATYRTLIHHGSLGSLINAIMVIYSILPMFSFEDEKFANMYPPNNPIVISRPAHKTVKP